MNIIIYSDGASSNNGKSNAKAGFGGVAFNKKNEKLFEVYGRVHGEQTNQRGELLGALRSLEKLDEESLLIDNIIVYTDSAYLCNCYNCKWWINWERNGWKNAKGQPVANQDLWKGLIPFFKRENIVIKKVLGHSGIEGNELADSLARKGVNCNRG